MPQIHRLSEHLVNRIAAGEVIERPAAAVKELVENALDAGATRIAITLEAGGIDRMVVEDDGAGMAPDDLLLAVQRHCTSKLPGGDSPHADGPNALVHITTLGFRGEALPSIGAAARLTLISRPPGAPHAHRLHVEGGRVGTPEPIAAPPGTRVTVSDLFFATPARRKFLKSPRTEAEHAEAAVTRLAFAAPGTAFRLELDGRCAFDLPAQPPLARIAALLRTDAALLPVHATRNDLTLTGFAAPPTHTRATPAAQSLVVNNRPVLDPLLRTAIRVAYRDVIEPGRYPVLSLHLHLPPDTLDVNVHPAKTELRFQDPAAIRSLVIGGLRAALAAGAGTAIPSISFPNAPSPSFTPRPHLHLISSRSHSAYPHAAAHTAPGFSEPILPLAPPGARPALAAAPEPQYPLGAAIAQIFDTYILAVSAEGHLVLVDQHAAHERLTHEALAAQHEAGAIRAQPLLLPAVVDLAPADAARLAAAAPGLARLGLELEPFGPGAILVRALPAALGTPDPRPLLQDLADTLAEGATIHDTGATPLHARLDAVIARLACHGSIRAGRRLAGAEMNALLRQMESTPRAATCSHGRPTVLRLTRAEIESLFGRR